MFDVEYFVNGEKCWFEMCKLLFINEKGEYIGLFVFGCDIISCKEVV